MYIVHYVDVRVSYLAFHTVISLTGLTYTGVTDLVLYTSKCYLYVQKLVVLVCVLCVTVSSYRVGRVICHVHSSTPTTVRTIEKTQVVVSD